VEAGGLVFAGVRRLRDEDPGTPLQNLTPGDSATADSPLSCPK